MNAPRRLVRLGTRRSPLAMAQSRGIAALIEGLVPGLQVELKGIETRGDRLLETALSRTSGRDFFTSEIDDALLRGRVDLAVHSLKDLSLCRPDGLRLAAIPRRDEPRDIALFNRSVIERIAKGKAIRIGSSSPRRTALLPPFLQLALPSMGPDPQIEFVEIRGNIDSRLRRLGQPPGSAGEIEGIVIALAGLMRLWAELPGKDLLGPLIEGLDWMVLPLANCPGAPGQGALAVETRASDHWLTGLLEGIHDRTTEDLVRLEREVLADWGGGCHLALGATAVAEPDRGSTLFIAGRMPSGEIFRHRRRSSPRHPSASGHGSARPRPDGVAGAGSGLHPGSSSNCRMDPSPGGPGALLDALVRMAGTRTPDPVIPGNWTQGTETWRRLGRSGIWVNGCVEDFQQTPEETNLDQSRVDRGSGMHPSTDPSDVGASLKNQIQ